MSQVPMPTRDENVLLIFFKRGLGSPMALNVIDIDRVAVAGGGQGLDPNTMWAVPVTIPKGPNVS